MNGICTHCRSLVESGVEACPHDGKKIIPNLTGEVIAERYAIRELLGVGGTEGSVWRGIQLSNERQVAIKLLPADKQSEDPRFERGAKIASALNHPNLTTIHDYGSEHGQLYLVMELLEGYTLQSVLRHGENLSPMRTAQIIEQALRGLEHAHRHMVIHRDIKPGNLFLTSKNEDSFLKILDFGIAKYASEGAQNEEGDLTGQHHICGTPQYMAPEQILMEKIDARTDIYSLGVVMYRMLTGRLPFPSGKTSEVLRHHVNSRPPSFSDIRPDLSIPQRFEEIAMRALEKSPESRFQTAREMRTSLREARHSQGLFFDEEASMSASLSASISMLRPPDLKPVRSGLSVPAVFGILGLLIVAVAAGIIIGNRGLDEGEDSPKSNRGTQTAKAEPDAKAPDIPEPKPEDQPKAVAEAEADAAAVAAAKVDAGAPSAPPTEPEKLAAAEVPAPEKEPKKGTRTKRTKPSRAKRSSTRRASRKATPPKSDPPPKAEPVVEEKPPEPAPTKPKKPTIGIIQEDKPAIGIID